MQIRVRKQRKKWTVTPYLCGLLFLIILGIPFPAYAANAYEIKPENYIAWNNMPTISTSEEMGYYQITDMGSYGANLTNDMSLGDGYYNSMHYYSDTRIIYQKKICATAGLEINLTGSLEDVGEGGLNTSAMGKISWNVMEWNASGGFLWDSGWITTEETYTVGLDERGHCSSWGIDYSVGSRESVAYITILFRFIDESGYDGAGDVPITPENVAEYFPNLFICYEPFTYTVDYNGYGSNATVKRLGGEDIDLSLSEKSNRPGYELRWKVISDSILVPNWMNGKVYKASEINAWLADGNFYNSLFGDVIFQAVYIPQKFTVTYNPNGGMTDATTKTFAYGDEVDLSPIAEKNGDIFVGWSTIRDSRLPLKNYTMQDGDVILYAVYSIPVSDVQNHSYPSYTPTDIVADDEVYLRVWIKEDSSLCQYYPLVYVSDVGSMTYRYTLPDVDISAFVNGRAYCYQLIAWDNAGNKKILYEDSSDGTKVEEPDEPDEPEVYKQVVEHYKYDACSKVWRWFEETMSRVEEGEMFVPAYINPPMGYHAESIDGGGVVYADQVYKAYYKPIEYCVTFDANGGTCDVASKIVLYEGYYGMLPIPTKIGQTFCGWNTMPDGSGKNITSGDVYTTAADSTLYAQYRANTYTITYHANGGSGKMDDTNIAYGEEGKLSPCAYELEGYTFAGWAESPRGEIRYVDRAPVRNLTAKDGDIFHLYAIYQKEITVNFVEMSDTGRITTTLSNEVYHWEPYVKVLVQEKGCWTGWTNIGWSDKTSATGDAITLTGVTFTANEDVTLYALYVSEVNVSYDTNGSAMDYDNQAKQCYYNASGNGSYPYFTIADAPVLSKHSFVRWNVTQGCVKDSAGKVLSFCQPKEEVMIEENTVFTAVWDAFPELEVYSRYFTLEEAQCGEITEEKLLGKVYGTDKEDGVLENGIDVMIVDYDASIFTGMTSEQEVEIVYQATDHSGNTVRKRGLVHIIDTTEKKDSKLRYVRFINPSFFLNDTGELLSYEQGGLEENSIWRKNAAYHNLLEKTLNYTGGENETWVFEKKDLDEIKSYTKRYGHALRAMEKFLELFQQFKRPVE